MPQHRRGEKFDWLYDQWLERGGFEKCVARCGLAGELTHALERERDHELRAALICLLTAAFAYRGDAAVIGDEKGGYFFLPPTDM
jgi:predicted RNase H-like nuclease